VQPLPTLSIPLHPSGFLGLARGCERASADTIDRSLLIPRPRKSGKMVVTRRGAGEVGEGRRGDRRRCESRGAASSRARRARFCAYRAVGAYRAHVTDARGGRKREAVALLGKMAGFVVVVVVTLRIPVLWPERRNVCANREITLDRSEFKSASRSLIARSRVFKRRR